METSIFRKFLAIFLNFDNRSIFALCIDRRRAVQLKRAGGGPAHEIVFKLLYKKG
jgi:hypothetical protein